MVGGLGRGSAHVERARSEATAQPPAPTSMRQGTSLQHAVNGKKERCRRKTDEFSRQTQPPKLLKKIELWLLSQKPVEFPTILGAIRGRRFSSRCPQGGLAAMNALSPPSSTPPAPFLSRFLAPSKRWVQLLLSPFRSQAHTSSNHERP
jgi:hypothetical protein